jgi:cellobiose PTS system EIIA component
MKNEQIIMQLISQGGSARSSSIEAIRKARDRDFEASEELLQRAHENLVKAHNLQTELLQKEATGQGESPTLLMVHAQDHLMNAMTVNDLAKELITILKEK